MSEHKEREQRLVDYHEIVTDNQPSVKQKVVSGFH